MKELKIIPPEGYVVDKENSTFEKIVFKSIDTKPRSWEEYCHNFKGELFFENNNSIDSLIIKNGISNIAKNYVPSEELAKAFLAMMQLMSLRQAWIGDWKHDWDDGCFNKFCICGYSNSEFEVILLSRTRHPLSFPTKEMATDFMNCFKDLLRTAKPLI